jgi:hypothetical protein
MVGRKCFDVVPPNILLRLATSLDAPKSVIPKLPQAKLLDSWLSDPYLGEIRFNAGDLKCYKYTENGWKEIK